jgi:cytochrome c
VGRRRSASALTLVAGIAVTGLLLATAVAAPGRPSPFRVLVFTKTAGFRHASIPAAVGAIRELGQRGGFSVDATEDATAFTDANLARYAVVAFVLTTGDVLDAGQQRAFERYIRAGHGFVGIHSATDTERGWPWYGQLVGGWMDVHSSIQQAAVVIEDRAHLSTSALPRRWVRTDEWYRFPINPRGSVRVLATLDESTYKPEQGTAMGGDHPIAWTKELGGGRAWYTAGGHTEESYAEPLFRSHLLGGIRYAAGLTPPSIVSVATSVRSRRVFVSVRYRDCARCEGRIEVRTGGRRFVTPIRLSGGSGRAATRRLPRGRWPVAVWVENRANRRSAVVRRSVRIS